MQEEGKAKQRYVEAIEKVKAELDENPSIQGKKAFDELRTEHFNFLNKLKQAELAQEKGKLVNYLFEKALSRLSSLEVPDKPSLFLVYAHENKAHGKAEAGTSKYLIEKLSQIQVVLYSDQTPIGQPYSSALGEVKKDSKLEDILTNQLCLLPGQLRSDVKPVDKVVVCCSDVLGSYLKWREYDSFYQKLKEAYGKDREAYLNGGEQGNAWAIREVVREFSEEEKYKGRFHHVLTEMAFLQIRAEELKDKHGIIPVPLTRNSYDACLSKFISSTTVRMGDIPRFEAQAQAGEEMDPNQSRHWVLFKLIERLLVDSDEAKTFLDKFWQGYSNCISWLKNESKLDVLESNKLVDGIFEEIERALHKQLAFTVQQVYPAWQQVDTRLLDQSRDLDQIQTGIDSLVARLLGNLQENIQRLRLNYLEGLEKDREIKDALATYVSLEGTPLHDSTRFDLEKKVQDFLSSDKKVLLLLGEAGSGKSTFNRHLAVGLWEAYVQASAVQNSPIPVFIQLSSLPESNRNLVEAFFETQGFSKEKIKELQTRHRFVLILDGFDEIKDRQRNFYKDNYLDGWKDAKIIISSRPEYLGSNYQYKFHPSGERNALQEYRIAPFSKGTIERYVDQYKKAHSEGPWSVAQYKEALKQPDLKELVGNPFLLKIALSVLPELSEKLRVAAQRFTRIALYGQFVKSWFERSQERLAQIGLSENEKEAFEILHDEGFTEHGIGFSKDLALEMYYAREVLVTYSPTSYSSRQSLNTAPEQDWHKHFFSNEDIRIKLKRLNAPVICQDKQNGLSKEYRFIHKSLQDYFVARALWEGLAAVDKVEVFSWFNRLNIVNDSDILSFLAERMQQEQELKERLLSVVEQSKGEDGAQFEVGAANALTVLVKGGVSLSSKDFSGINARGADLSYGIFDHTQFEGADLSGVKLRGCWLYSANMRKANLKNVEFGEMPALEAGGRVFACAYSPDGHWLALGISFGGCRLYEIIQKENQQDIKLKYKLGGSFFGIRWPGDSVAFSPDSRLLASADCASTLRLWLVETGGLRHTFRHSDNGSIPSIAFSLDGQWLVSAGNDGTIKLWTVETGEQKYVFEEGRDMANSISISPDGKLLASGGAGKSVKLWELGDTKATLLQTLEEHKEEITSVSFSRRGKWLASGSNDGAIKLWELGSAGALLRQTLEANSGVKSIIFSPGARGNPTLESQWLASGSTNGIVRLWDLRGPQTVFNRTFDGHKESVDSISFSPDGKWLASGSWDRTVKLWKLGNEEMLPWEGFEGRSGKVKSISISLDGKWLASGGDDKTVKLWQLGNIGATLRQTFEEHSSQVGSVAISPDAKWLASGSDDKTIKLWRLNDGMASSCQTLESHEGPVSSVSISPDGEWLASGSDDKTVKLWKLKSAEATLHQTFAECNAEIKSVSISPNGKWLVSGDNDRTITLWKLNDEGALFYESFKYHSDKIKIDAEWLDNNSKLKGLESIKASVASAVASTNIDLVASVSISPDGKWLASGNFDCTLELWELGNNLGASWHRKFKRHKWNVTSVCFSQDSKWLMSGSFDGAVKLWSVNTGECKTTIQSFIRNISSIACQEFSEKTVKIIVGGSGNTIRIFLLEREENEWKSSLYWTSNQSELSVMNLIIKDAKNLDLKNKHLIVQRQRNVDTMITMRSQMLLVYWLNFSMKWLAICINWANSYMETLKNRFDSEQNTENLKLVSDIPPPEVATKEISRISSELEISLENESN